MITSPGNWRPLNGLVGVIGMEFYATRPCPRLRNGTENRIRGAIASDIAAFGIVGDEDGGWCGVHDGFEFGRAGTRSHVAGTEQVFRPLQLDISIGQLVNRGPQVGDVALPVAGDAAADKGDYEQVQVDDDDRYVIGRRAMKRLGAKESSLLRDAQCCNGNQDDRGGCYVRGAIEKENRDQQEAGEEEHGVAA